jgi:hypothetical protein
LKRRTVKLKIDKAAIDEAFKQITDDMSEQDRDDLAKRAAKMAVLVKNPERVRAVVEHIVSTTRPRWSRTASRRRWCASTANAACSTSR